jgi:hypothetical protein
LRPIIDVIRQFLYAPEARTMGTILLLAVWIGGIAYVERVADETEFNEWIARLLSIFLPVLAPAFFWHLRRQNRRHRRYRRRPTIL